MYSWNVYLREAQLKSGQHLLGASAGTIILTFGHFITDKQRDFKGKKIYYELEGNILSYL